MALPNRRAILLAVSLVVALVLVITFGELRVRQIVDFGRAAAQLPNSLDPTESLSEIGNAIVNSCYEGLVDIDKNGRVLPCLASHWEVKDSTTYTFTIVSGVTFSDGTRLTPDLVAKSLQRSFLSRAIPRVLLPELSSITQDRASLTITLARPAKLLPLLAAPPMRITYSSKPGVLLGTGPYMEPKRSKVADFNRISLSRNPEYRLRFRGPEHLHIVELDEEDIPRAFRLGVIDDTSLYPGYSDVVPAGTEETSVEAHDTWVFGVNAKRTLTSRRHRLSLAQAIPYGEFRSRFLRNHQPSTGFVPPGIVGHDPTLQPLSSSEPPSFLSELGAIEVIIPRELFHSQEMCQLLQNRLGRVCHVSCQAVPFEELLERMKRGDFDIALYSMTLDYPIDEYFAFVFDSSSDWHPTLVDSPIIRELTERIRRLSSPENLAMEMKRLNSYLRTEGLVFDLSYPMQRSIVRKGITGHAIGWAGPAYLDYAKLRRSVF